ncbi:MAG: HAD family hydrolase [Spirochaetota bacterium]
MKIKAVAFDIDGTLYPNYQLYFRSIPLFISNPRLALHFSKVRKRIRTIRPITDFRKLQAELLSEAMNISYSRSFRLIEENIYTRWESTFHGIKVYPQIRTLLKELKEEGLKLGVLSDFPVARKLEYLKLNEGWDCTICSEETGYLKPNPEPFMRLSEDLDTSPGEILYVGNHYEYDVVGALRAGLKAAHIGKKQNSGSKADLTFSSIDELRNCIREFINN